MSNVAPGEYEIVFTTGDHWTGHQFNDAASYMRFERSAFFAERVDDDGVHYAEIEATLNRVLNGNTRTEHIPPFQLDILVEQAAPNSAKQ
jgi:hypothetical protein